jgi:hypothetical protein
MNKNSNNDLQNTTQKTEDRATCASYVEFNHYLLNPTRFWTLLGFIAPKTFNYLAVQSFDFERHLMNVFSKARRAH